MATNVSAQGRSLPLVSSHEPNSPVYVIDAVDELVTRAKDMPELRRFHRFHLEHREVLQHLAVFCLQQDGAFSFHAPWEAARWSDDSLKKTERFKLPDELIGWYCRIVLLLFPELNGQMALRTAKADTAFGLRIAAKRLTGDYARRLEWADGSPLESWRPSAPRVARGSRIEKTKTVKADA
jgi:hypothetical protein